MGNFSFQVNHVVKHDLWFNNAPWNDAESFSGGFFRIGLGKAQEASRSSLPTTSSGRAWRTERASSQASSG